LNIGTMKAIGRAIVQIYRLQIQHIPMQKAPYVYSYALLVVETQWATINHQLVIIIDHNLVIRESIDYILLLSDTLDCFVAGIQAIVGDSIKTSEFCYMRVFVYICMCMYVLMRCLI